jgi:hypothetical protein
MGGPGSGSHYQWWRGSKKTTAEACEAIDANRWMREGILKPGVDRVGSWRWIYHGGRENSITYEVNTLDQVCPFVRLSYTVTRAGTQERESFDYRVSLTTTQPHFGGLRWWFVCPLLACGHECARRVGKLYLPPRGLYFGCRHCHELTYKSTQTHDKRVDVLRRNPALLAAILENPKRNFSEMLLALKAIQ